RERLARIADLPDLLVDLGELVVDRLHERELGLEVGRRRARARVLAHLELRRGRRLIAHREARRVRAGRHLRPGRGAGPEDHAGELLRIGIAQVPGDAVVAVEDVRQLVRVLYFFVFFLRLRLRGPSLGFDG